MDSKETHMMERFVRIACSVIIVILGIYIGIKLYPFLPSSIKNKISSITTQWTESAIEEMTLLSGYFSDEPEYPETVQDFIVNVIDTPIGIYTYLTSRQKNENDSNHDKKKSQEEENSTELSKQDSAEEKTEETTILERENQDEGQRETSTEDVRVSISISEGDVENESVKTVQLIPTTSLVTSKIITLSQTGTISLENMLDYTYLIKNFYVIDSSTSVTEDVLNPTTLLSKDVTIAKNVNEPQILIYHTHSQEAFADSVAGEIAHTIVGVGDYLTEILTNQYGYNVLHHTGVYDMENGELDRKQAYNRALPAIEAILEQYPSIEVVIDLHRDGVADNIHLVTEVNGKQVARLMFFNGLCRDTSGELAEVSNPYREDNLAFSLQMGLHLKTSYPEVLRVLYLQKNRYNQHVASRCLLVETGAQTNTVEEAMNAMEILAEILNDVLS